MGATRRRKAALALWSRIGRANDRLPRRIVRDRNRTARQPSFPSAIAPEILLEISTLRTSIQRPLSFSQNSRT